MDAEYTGFQENLKKLGEVCGEDVSSWKGYLAALRKRRAFFKENGATATDHGHLTAHDCGPAVQRGATALYERIYTGKTQAGDVELFQAQMLTEMAGMSVEDGLTMQLHPGSIRNHNALVYDEVRARQGGGHSFADGVCARAAAAALEVWERAELYADPVYAG